jgi:hypothetical protein
MYNFYVYQFIRNNGGFDNWSMIILEEYQCENKNQAELRERYYIELLQSTLNTNRPAITRQEKLERQKEYYDENKERIKEERHKYYEANKEKFREWYEANKEANKEERREKFKEYYEANKKKIRECQKEYQAKKRQLITQENQEL